MSNVEQIALTLPVRCELLCALEGGHSRGFSVTGDDGITRVAIIDEVEEEGKHMISMGKESKRIPAEVVDFAVQFFGPPGLGLEVADRGACCVNFEGGGGHVFVQAADLEGKKGSEVRIEGREWDYQIKEFMGKV